MSLTIYLDHSATTRVWPEVIAGLTENLSLQYANPSSVHRLGRSANKLLTESKNQIAGLLGCQKTELTLTSGGSESINLAIKGYLAANPRQARRIISSMGEHAATSETLTSLRLQGYEIEELALQPDGRVNLQLLAQALVKPAALISLIHVSNETGAVNDAAEIVRLRNSLQPSAAIHLDAVQTLGRQPLDFGKLGVEMLSGSGHKIGAPKSIGWLLVKKGTRLTPQILGGGQQGLRAGTENPPLAAALALAVQLTCQETASRAAIVRNLRQLLLSELTDGKVDYQILSPQEGVPQILLLAFPGLRGETLLHALEAKSIYISTGAACSSHNKKTNRVLQSMGVPDGIADCTVRISLAATNTPEEIIITVKAIIASCRWLIK